MICKPKHRLLIFIFLCYGCFKNPLISQSLNDTLKLKEVEIKSSYLLNNQGFKKVRIDSSLLLPRLNTDLSTILSQNSTIFIKSYGNGGIATASFRGTSANHTQVEWNGININSPMLGQTDLSQVPVSQFDGIEILYGAAGIPRTSGAFGGVINLVSNPDWNNRINLLVAPTIASFSTFNTNLNFSTGTNTFQTVTKFNYSISENDFPYYDNNYQIQEQRNASYRTYGITEELFFRIKKKDYLSAKVWYNYDYRNIPPVVTNTDSSHNENQMEKTWRSLLEWKRIESKYSFTLRSAFIDQLMNYKNDSLDADHNYNSWINRLRFSLSGIKRLNIKPGADINFDRVISDSYDGIKTRTTVALFSEFYYEIHRKLQLSLIIREEFIDDQFMPFIPAIGIDYKPFNEIGVSFSTNLSKNYRYPSLNDLYWSVSGNPDLRPETDYSAEMSTVYHFINKKQNFFLEAELTGYYSYMKDLILWYPIEGGSLWKPENVSEVLSRGLEAGLNFSWTFLGFTAKLNNNYHFCKATYEKAISPSDASVGNQLIYTPVNTFNSTLSVNKMGFYFSYNFSFVGKRYTGKDNLSYMDAYNLSNIILGKNFVIKNFVLSLQVQINNLFDLALRSIASIPMPGRNYALTIRFNFNK